jgi:hypothetical protein
MRDDEIIRKIRALSVPAPPVVAECRNKGYTLLQADTGRPIARLRPLGTRRAVEDILLVIVEQRWAPTDTFGRTGALIDKALRIIANEPIFWAGF